MGEKTSIGLDENIAGLLCYLLTIVTGIVFYVIEKENKFVRFHAVQSIIVFGALWLLHILVIPILVAVPVVGWIIGSLWSAIFSLLGLVLWLLLMYKAFSGEKYKIPIAGDLAEQYS